MDLRTHLGVLSRWRWVVAIGVAIALLLTFFSYYRVNGSGITHRQSVTWQSSEVLQLTQPGCEYCRAVPSSTTDLGWLTTLTTVYAQLANGDELRNRVFRGKHTDTDYVATPVVDPTTPNQTQFLTFAGSASSPAEAVEITRRASSMFLAFLADQSTIAGVSAHDRILLQVVTKPSLANTKVVKDRKKTIPIVVFLSVLVAIFAFAYVAENLYPRALQGGAGDEEESDIGLVDSSRKPKPARAAAGD